MRKSGAGRASLPVRAWRRCTGLPWTRRAPVHGPSQGLALAALARATAAIVGEVRPRGETPGEAGSPPKGSRALAQFPSCVIGSILGPSFSPGRNSWPSKWRAMVSWEGPGQPIVLQVYAPGRDIAVHLSAPEWGVGDQGGLAGLGGRVVSRAWWHYFALIARINFSTASATESRGVSWQ